jgi:hypothetical protein
MPIHSVASAPYGVFITAVLRILKNPRSWFVFLTSFMLATLFYFHDIRVEEVKIGTVSDRYVMAQVDFEHIDKTATKILQNQAKYQVGSLFKLDERAVLLQLQNLKEETFKSIPNASKTEIDSFIERLLKVRFTDAKTVRKLDDLKWDGPETFYIYSEKSGGLPENFWRFITPKNSSDYILRLTEKLESIPFLITPDISLENKVQSKMVDTVEPIKTYFRSGQILIAPGDKILDFHKEILFSMKEAIKLKKNLFSLHEGAASLVLGVVFTALYAYYLRKSHADIFFNFSKLMLLSLLIMMGIGGAKALEYLVLETGIYSYDALRNTPILALTVLLISILIDRTVALLSLLLMIVVSYLFLAFEPGRFMLINLMGSACILLTSIRIHRRRQIFSSAFYTYLFLIPGLIAFHVYDDSFKTSALFYDLLVNFGFMLLGCLAILFLLPFIERLFKVTTNMTLTDFLDPNHELLRRLTLEAPGTYQHSLLVGHLAEYGARAIGANDLFCRVASLYHDVGKVYNPQYFTENQLGGFNIHRLLTPKESAQVIMAHVDEGEKLARKFKLPESFIEIMKEHHGTTLVYFFYKNEIDRLGGNTSKVNESDFRYKGNKPKSKESAIIMLADCIEAASRSLDESSEDALTRLVEKIVKDRLFEGQLEECHLTFNELTQIKKAFVKGLMVTHHVRVRYPMQGMVASPMH